MSYLDERDQEEGAPKMDLSAFSPRTTRKRDDDALRTGAAVARERGFGAHGAPAAIPPTPATQVSVVQWEGKRKPRRMVSRAKRTESTETGQMTLTGRADVLDEFVRRATWERKKYVEFLSELLETYEAEKGPVPQDFR